MSYASRFFQSVGATNVHASPERLTSIANAVNGRKALRHAFESARYGERAATMLYAYQRKMIKKTIARCATLVAVTPAIPSVRTVDGVSEGASYMPKRRNQHSKSYTVCAIYSDKTVAFRRGDAGKLGFMTMAQFIDTVKL